MKQILQVLAVFIVLFLLVSCSIKTKEEVYEDISKEDVKEAVDDFKNVVADYTKKETKKSSEPKKSTQTKTQVTNPDLMKLLDKGNEINSYAYSYKTKRKNSFGNVEEGDNYQVYIKNEKVKKIHAKFQKLNEDVFYNEVYLDNKKEEAFVVCTLVDVMCDKNRNTPHDIRYDYEKLGITPMTVLESIPKDAESAGSQTVNSRSSSAFRYDQYGKQIKVYLDKYYGIPLKKEIYKYNDDKTELIESYSFKIVSVKNVFNSDVTFSG